MNKTNTNDAIARMKALMGYGLQTENKQAYSSVEYQKVGADGKIYGIVREGTKFYIKTAPNKANLVKEDFSYINGFRNRKENEYTSFANAQKQFDLKMMSIKEAANKDDFSVNSWDLDKKENVVIEATEGMKKEILRERQIMKNAARISEAKKGDCNGISCDIADTQKPNIKSEEPKTGNAADAVDYEKAELPKEMTEGKEVLGWNRGNDDYMDTTHGTEIGDSAPFDDAEARNIDDGDKKVNKTSEMNNGTVEEGASMHDSDNQNTPTPGVGEIGDNQPFDGEKGKKIDEGIEDIDGDDLGDDELGGDEFGAEEGEPIDGDDEFGAEEGEPIDADDELGDDEIEDEDDVYEDDLNSRMDAMEDMLSQIAAKLGIGAAPVDDEAYEGDDDIFGDEEGEEDFGTEEEIEDGLDYDIPMESMRRNGVQIFESKGYQRAMRRQKVNEDGMKPFKDAGRVPSGNMNKLNNWGEHPAYQKKVMELPPKDMQEFEGYYDMNDESVKNDAPYGEKIGDGSPFNIDPQAIDNAISESIKRQFIKKK